MLLFFILLFFIFSTNANFDLTCPRGATLFHDNKTCYLVVKDSKNFYDAEDACNKQGGNLAMVQNRPENMFISYLVDEALESFKYYWIGGIMQTVMANGGKSVDLWTWTKDDALMTFSDWDQSAAATGTCSGVENNSLWSAIDCRMRNPFVCEIPVTNDYNGEFCDDEWTHFSLTHSCYREFQTGYNQSIAESNCVQEGGHLASIHSDEENQFIGDLTSIGFETGFLPNIFWIGAERKNNSDNWHWLDGTSFHYVNWGGNHDHTDRFCVSYWPDYSANQEIFGRSWTADYCVNNYSYLCKKQSNKKQSNSPTNAVSCPSDATLFHDNKTCYLVVKDSKSFADAEDACNKQGGNLAMVRNQYENVFIIPLVFEALGNFKYYWIGGTLRTVMMNAGKSADLWTWTKDNALMIFSDWHPSENATGNCTGVDGNGYWFANDCNMSNPFVCKIPAIDYSYEFCDDGWIHFNLTHSCYKKFLVTGVNQLTAENLCVQKGGHLASIHSIVESQFINDYTSVGYEIYSDAPVFWIGGIRNNNSDNWRWTDKTAFDFVEFGNTYDYTDKFCVDYWPYSMIWNADNCLSYLNSYLCKKESYKA